MKKWMITLFIPLYFAGCGGAANEQFPSEITDAYSLYKLGNKILQKGDYSNAAAIYLDSYNKFSLVDFIPGKIETALKIAVSLKQSNDTSGAFSRIEEVNLLLPYHPSKRIDYLKTLAEFYFIENKYSEVLLLPESVQPGDKDMIILAFKLLSGSNINSLPENILPDLKEAVKIGESLYKKDELINPVELSFALYSLAYNYFENKNYNDSEIGFISALEIDKKYSNYQGIAASLYMIGKVNKETKNYDEGIVYFSRAMSIYKALDDIHGFENANIELLNLKIISSNNSSRAIEELRSFYSNTQFPDLKEKAARYLKLIN